MSRETPEVWFLQAIAADLGPEEWLTRLSLESRIEQVQSEEPRWFGGSRRGGAIDAPHVEVEWPTPLPRVKKGRGQRRSRRNVLPKIRFDCQNCGRPLVFRDDGRPVQWFNCVCGVGTIYKDVTREGWLD